MSHTTEWEGLAYPEQRPPQPKVPGPLKGGGSSWDRGRRQVTVTMFHNGDFSGNVKFILPNKVADASVVHGAGPNGEGMAEVHIPFDAVLRLVLEYYRRRLISALESVSELKDMADLLSNYVLEDAADRLEEEEAKRGQGSTQDT